MADTAKAAVFVGMGKPMEVQEFPMPTLEPGAILVSMDMAAICGSDAHALHHESTPAPMIFGHENIGTIADLGSGPRADCLGQPLREGDRILFRAAPCGRCLNCARGNFCLVPPQPGFIKCDEPPHLQGGFGQYLYLNPNPWLLKVPDDMSIERALVSVVGTHTLLNGIERMGGIGLGDTVVVQGSGPMGIGGLIMAKLLGAGRCIVIGAPPNRLELAKEMGADDTVDIGVYNEPDARVAKIQEMTGGKGADVVIECSGAPAATAEGLEMVRFDGKYLIVGPWTDYGPQPVNPSWFPRKAIRATGVLASEPRHIIRAMKAIHTMVEAPVEKLVTHQFPLAQINEAFESHEKLTAMIAVIRPNA